MMTIVHVTVDLEIRNCCRCGLNQPIEPFELRRGELGDPTAWRVGGWREPNGWHVFRWPNGKESASCPDCWPEIEKRAGMFIEKLREGVQQWVDPLALCARPTCSHARAAHVAGSCSTLAVGCACTSFVEPSTSTAS